MQSSGLSKTIGIRPHILPHTNVNTALSQFSSLNCDRSRLELNRQHSAPKLFIPPPSPDSSLQVQNLNLSTPWTHNPGTLLTPTLQRSRDTAHTLVIPYAATQLETMLTYVRISHMFASHMQSLLSLIIPLRTVLVLVLMILSPVLVLI